MYLTLPNNARPSRALSTDASRPVLCAAHLRQDAEGVWLLEATDSYKLVQLRLALNEPDDGPEPVAGPISTEALKAAEKAGGFRATATHIEPCGSSGMVTHTAYARPTCLGNAPDFDVLLREPDPAAFRISLDAKFLLDCAQALGTPGRHAHVVLEFVADEQGRPARSRPMLVTTATVDGRAMLMPVRLPD